MWVLYAFLAAVTASLVWVFAKLGLKGLDSTLATTVRSVIMTLFLLGTSGVLGKMSVSGLQAISGRDWVLIAGSGIAGALSWLFGFAALRTGETTQVAAIDKLSLVFIAILGVLFLGEVQTWRSALGIGLIVAGTLLATVFKNGFSL